MDKHYKPGEKINNYTVTKIIGEGRYGIVYLAQDPEFNVVVIKQLKEDMLKKCPEKIFYEENILKKLSNPHFPKFISSFKDNDIQGYILEYIEGNNFEDLTVRYGYRFIREEIYMIANQLISLIKILHANNVVHRDIRLPNVIVKQDKELVLLDFGLARYIDNKKHSKKTDYWYLSDFLIHLYYTSYYYEPETAVEEKPWFEELDLNNYERNFLKKLMGIDGEYSSIEEIENDFKIITNLL